MELQMHFELYNIIKKAVQKLEMNKFYCFGVLDMNIWTNNQFKHGHR